MTGPATITAMATYSPTGNKPVFSDPFGSDFYHDLAGLYGSRVDAEACAQNRLYTFEELATPVMDCFLREKNKPKPDLLIIAHYIPNCVSYNSTTSYLQHQYDLKAFLFAVSDLGTAPLLVAVKLASDFLQSGAYERAIVLGIDQTSVPQNHAVIAGRNARENCVGLYLERSASHGWSFVDFHRAPGGPASISVGPHLERNHIASAQASVLTAAGQKLDCAVGTHLELSPALLATASFSGLAALPTSSPFAVLTDHSLGQNTQLLLKSIGPADRFQLGG